MSLPSGASRPVAPAAAAPRPVNTKVVHFMRHGLTEMNVYLKRIPMESPGFKDPMLFDTRLTPDGVSGARKAALLTATLSPTPEVLLVSPLTRTLHTAALAFPHYKGRIEVDPLVRERVWLSADCGRSPQELQADFPDGRYKFDHLPQIWWWNGNSPDPKNVSPEPESVFKARVQDLKRSLMARPESCIAMVAHWGVLLELTGGDYRNCQVMTYRLDENGFTMLQQHPPFLS